VLNLGSDRKMRKVGLIGCGAIGSLIAEAFKKGIVECDSLILYDYDVGRTEEFRKSLGDTVTVVKTIEEMIRLKPKVIVEAASQQAAKDYIPKILEKNIELIVMSVGALLDLRLQSNKIHVPSGAIGGLDAISAASLAGIDEAILTSRKNPLALGLDSREEKLVYEGNAEDAVKRFPREMNVAATLALAIGSEKLKVRVVSDPKVNRNIHEIAVKWKYGDMLLRFSNDPHPENPRTSALAAWSAIRLLKEVLERSE
jgi:aspartate dehydrogenase